MRTNRFSAQAMPGQEIVMTGWIGLEGTAIIAEEKEKELLERYNKSFIDKAKRMRGGMSLTSETEIAKKAGVSSMYPVEDGGIFAALWKMGAETKEGLEVDLHKILVKQETVEICEFYNISPYMLRSNGCMIMISDKAYYLVEKLIAEGIMAAVIGFMTDSNGRLVINGEEGRYLVPPEGDEIYKVLKI